MSARPEVPARMGPRPLWLHLAAAMSASVGSSSAWQMSRLGWPGSSPATRTALAELHRDVAALGAEAFAAALDREARRRLAAFLDGVERYRHHPAGRRLDDAPVVWSEGTTRLRDYGPDPGGSGGGPAVLVVPSLVNRAYILDLDEETSLMRHLAAHGLRPLMVDWDAPGEEELAFDLDDYIAGRLARALEAAAALAGAPVFVLGYCMGGLLGLALALRHRTAVRGLALLAVPWDFHADSGGPPPGLAPLVATVLAAGAVDAPWPVDLLQAMFFAIDPMQGWRKFRAFAEGGAAEPAQRRFVAVEDWANDGVPLAGKVARECLLGWYVANAPVLGRWRVAGVPVLPAEWNGPSLVIAPARDRIVPQASAAALGEALAGADRLAPPLGHIGMIVARGARAAVWAPLCDWLLARA